MKKYYSIMIMCLSAGLMSGAAWGVGSGGFMNQVVGTKALGAGSAFAALADDPSTIFYNPAGLMQLPGSQVSLGTTLLTFTSKYSGTSGQSAELEKKLHVIPNLYFTHRLPNEKFAAGIGFYSHFGLSTEWPKDSPLRYVATKSDIKTFSVNPSVAYQISPTFLVGGGIDYLTIYNVELSKQLNLTLINDAIRLSLSLPPTGTVYPDGSSQLKGNGDGWGYNLGLLFKPSPKHQFGTAYRSEINTTIEGDVKLDGLTNESSQLFGDTSYKTVAKTPLDLPQSLLLGYAFKPTLKWIFTGDYEWVGWSEMKETRISYAETSASRLSLLNADNPQPRSWKDSSNVGLGVHYTVNPTWQVRGGYWYFERVVPNRTFDPGLPENTRNTLTLGASLNLKSTTIDFAYNAIFLRDRHVDNTVGSSSNSMVDGTYKTFSHLVAVNLTRRFSTPSN